MGVILRQTAGSYFPKCAGSYFPFTNGSLRRIHALLPVGWPRGRKCLLCCGCRGHAGLLCSPGVSAVPRRSGFFATLVVGLRKISAAIYTAMHLRVIGLGGD